MTSEEILKSKDIRDRILEHNPNANINMLRLNKVLAKMVKHNKIIRIGENHLHYAYKKK